MKKYLRRLYMKTETEKFNPFLHVFILKSFAIGLMFTAFGATDKIHGTYLFELTNDYLPDQAGNLWGISLLLVTFGHVLEMLFRGRWFGSATSMLGFSAWTYAGIIYIMNGNMFALVAITGTSIFFYAWYFVSSRDYKMKLKSGQIPPIS